MATRPKGKARETLNCLPETKDAVISYALRKGKKNYVALSELVMMGLKAVSQQRKGKR